MNKASKMIKEFIQEGISEIKFGYNSQMEGYLNSSSDINELGEIPPGKYKIGG
ncbi:hypothetical protein KKG19_05540 [Patescibacteria group bacterium]|nr:hypothetical protein [Patescibacteria group bacterium]